MFPASWPGSAEDTWLLKMAEAHAVEMPSDLDSFLQKAFVDLDHLLKKVGVAQGMQHFASKPEIEPRLSAEKFPAENWQKLKNEGF